MEEDDREPRKILCVLPPTVPAQQDSSPLCVSQYYSCIPFYYFMSIGW